MSKKKTKENTLKDLKIGTVYWSNHYKEYIIYKELDFDFDCVFQFTTRYGYCVPNLDNIIEAPIIIQLLFSED